MSGARRAAQHLLRSGKIVRMGSRRLWHGWSEGDFVDSDTQRGSVEEPDPWEFNESLSYVQVDPEERRHSSLGQSTNVGIDPEGIGAPYDLIDDQRHGGYPADGEWSGDAAIETSGWDEPEPMIEARSGLSESLYPPDDTITDLSLELKIGELLTRVKPISEQQQGQCVELLKELEISQLRRMLPWLRDRGWQGSQLRLFLEFRRHWESSPNIRWWETFFWSEREGAWIPRYHAGTLTLDHVRQLVLARSRYGARHVIDLIDDEWFRDWEAYAPWELGVRSFADFVVFRAELPAGEDWLEHLIRQDRRDALEIEQCLDPTFAPFMLPSVVRQYGLVGTHFAEIDPWPRATEFAYEMAAQSRGGQARAWYDTLRGRTNV